MIFAPRASKHLVDIYKYIAQDNTAEADKHHARLIARCELLAHQPRMGRPRDDVKQGFRSVTEGEYVIFYRIISRTKVKVIGIIHSKLDVNRVKF